MPEKRTILAEQFDDIQQQEHAATTGMWVFIATEVLFFGGLFVAYVIYRQAYPAEFGIGCRHSSLVLGTVNTAILLSSSFTMAIAVQFAQAGYTRRLAQLLTLTAVLGMVFLTIKGVEYQQHFVGGLVPGSFFRSDLPKQTQLFFLLYFVMTGLHALHVLIGICALGLLARRATKSSFSADYYTPIKIVDLYWHFVDVIWVFLYPLFYLIHK